MPEANARRNGTITPTARTVQAIGRLGAQDAETSLFVSTFANRQDRAGHERAAIKV
jgi:hypothetical protein